MTTLPTLSPDALLDHEAFVLGLARGLTRDESSAHDLAQDAWLSALGSRPANRNLRGWFYTVLKNRAAERGRREGRRLARETAVARPESQAAPLPLERIELNQSVVQAVLALEEPYRGVVIAVYYEGLTPSAIAARDAISTGTVRSRLSRALDKLKGKLDIHHGERQVWSAPLFQLWEPRTVQAAATAATPTAWWPWLAVAGALATGGLIGLMQSSRSGAIGTVSQAALTLGTPEDSPPDAVAIASPLTRPAAEPSRVAAVQSPPASSQLPALTTVASMLQRLRQVKTVILDRALAVDLKDVERFAWLKTVPNAGVTRVLNRVNYGAEFSLPWMREGGSYFSFTENVHDFNRRPQVSYSGGNLMAEGRENALLDLGRVPLESIGTTPTWNGRVLNTVDTAEFEIAWTTIDPSHPQLKTLADHRRRASDAAQRFEGTSSQDLQAILRGRRRLRLVSRIGHAFLMRVRAKAEYDALIAFEVVRADDDGCTLAWRVLKTWPIEDERSLWKPRMLRSALPEPPAAIVAMTNADLRDELVLALEAADERLFQTFPVEIESRFGHLRGQPQCGLARLLPYLGPWTELCNAPAHGSVLSPFDGDHDSQYSYIGFQGLGRSARLHPGLDGGVFGIVADLGKIDLDTVTRASITGLGGASGDIALTHKFEQLAYEPNRPKFDEDRWKLRRTNQMAFRKKLEENGVRESAVAAVGRTYLVRAIRFEDRDVLFAVHVAGLDQYGAIIAWRVLESKIAEPLE